MITLKVTENDETAKFTVNGTKFYKDLKLVTSIFKSGADIMLSVSDGKFCIVANDNTKTLCYAIDAENIEGNACFIITSDVFSGIVNNRSEIEFVLNESTLKFKALKGKYSGEMSTEPVNSNVIDQLNETFSVEVKSLSIPDSVFSVLEKGIKHCALTDAYGELDQELIRHIIGKEDKVKIISFDQFHSAMLETTLNKKLKRNFHIAVYQSYFSAINSLSKGEKFSIAISDNYFYVSNDKFFLSLPPIQYSDEDFQSSLETMDAVFDYERAAKCKVSTESFSKVIDNLCSIYELGSRIDINLSKNKMKLSLTTNYGSMNDTISVDGLKGNGLVSIDAPPINDVLGCAPNEDCTFTYIDGKAYTLEYEFGDSSLKYLIAVIQVN